MENCNNCGKEIWTGSKDGWYDLGVYCNGILTMNEDPFAVEIHGDYTLYENCEGGRQESAWDI